MSREFESATGSSPLNSVGNSFRITNCSRLSVNRIVLISARCEGYRLEPVEVFLET